MNSLEHGSRNERQISSWAPVCTIALGMSVGLLGDDARSVAETLVTAATLAGLFQLLLSPLLQPWRRSCRGPLFLPLSAVLCAVAVGWCLLWLALPGVWTLSQSWRVHDPTMMVLKSLDSVTWEMVTQVGLSWLLGLFACLWARRGCRPNPARPAVPTWRLIVGLISLYPVILFCAWLLHLWWRGGQLDSELQEFCQHDGYGDIVACEQFRRAIDQVNCKEYEVFPEAPRPFCGNASWFGPQLPELLQWPRRAEVNDSWRRYRRTPGFATFRSE